MAPPADYSDAPVNRSGDGLGRLSYADRVIELLDRVASSGNSTVAALVGPWGSGKSSLLEMIREGLRLDGQWRVTEFNPWYFNDVSTLVEKFFSELTKALPEGVGDETRKKVASFFRAVSPYGKFASLAGVDVSASLEAIGKAFAGDESLDAAQEKLSDALRKMGYKLLVVIDDLDRLQPEEVLLVFKLVRLVGNLPNVYYLLSFDERSIIDALRATSVARDTEMAASRYLEKIVQLRIDVPVLNDVQVRSSFESEMKTLSEAEEDRLDLDEEELGRLDELYNIALREAFRVPRSIKRFFRQVQSFYSPLRREVNVVDFFALTYLRLAYGSVYAQLPRWKNDLLGNVTAEDFATDSNPTKEMQVWRRRLTDRCGDDESFDEVLGILALIFPPVRSVRKGSTGRGNSHHAALSGKQRAGSADYFDRYFQFSIPTHEMPDSKALEYLRSLVSGSSEEQVGDEFIEPLNRDPIAVLTKLSQLIGSVAVVDPRPLGAALAEVYPKLDSLERQSWVDGPQKMAVETLTSAFLRSSTVDLYSSLEALASENLRTAADVIDNLKRGEVADQSSLQLAQELVGGGLKTMVTALERPPRVDEDYGNYLMFFDWRNMSSPADVVPTAQQLIRDGSWSFEDYLALIVPYRIYKTSEGTSYRYSEVSETYLARYIDFDYALNTAGDSLDQDLRSPEEFIDKLISHEDSIEYMLACLQVLRQRWQHQED